MGYLDSTGLARLVDNIQAHTVSLTTLAIPLVPSGWLESPLLEGYSHACEVTATGVTSSSLVVVNPTPESMDAYSAAGIACISQTTNSLAFACTSQPSDTIDVIVTVFNGGNTLYGVASDTENLSVSKSCASAGETITVTNLTNEAQSWTLNGVDQTDISANGTATFTMPSERVVVGEAFSSGTVNIGYGVYVVNNDTGEFVTNGDVVSAGTTLLLGSNLGTCTIYVDSGPTYDDRTRVATYTYFNDELVGGSSIPYTMPNSNIYLSSNFGSGGGVG